MDMTSEQRNFENKKVFTKSNSDALL